MENKKKTQADRILEYMRDCGGITTMEAFNDLGVTRLSARIFEIVHDRGIPVKKERMERRNRFGEKVRFDRYSIDEA